ncbi:MAG: ribonuclease HI family protein [Thermodesulfobacteriota bacterium]
MSQGRSLEGGEGQEAALLRLLADGLTEEMVTRLALPASVETVRSALRRAANRLAPEAPPAVAAPPAAPPSTAGLASLSLFTDGASRGNPGQAGAGWVIRDEQGQELLAHGKYLGCCTNNQAEYQALLLGLAAARQLGGGRIAVFLDSELIVRQINGQYRVKDEKLKPLYAQAKEALKAFTSCRVDHVPRAQNQRADELANRAIDQRL